MHELTHLRRQVVPSPYETHVRLRHQRHAHVPRDMTRRIVAFVFEDELDARPHACPQKFTKSKA